MWIRQPFHGGCSYVSGTIRVTGYYPGTEHSEAQESQCQCWWASNMPGRTFKSADAAMDEADEVFWADHRHHINSGGT